MQFADEVIISQIRNTRTVYRLVAADIIDLHNFGVSEENWRDAIEKDAHFALSETPLLVGRAIAALAAAAVDTAEALINSRLVIFILDLLCEGLGVFTMMVDKYNQIQQWLIGRPTLF